jgi:uncharacterized protein YcfL|tara:strand:+ start:1681 stop:1986 length:306 start_codon:yes stop_codon:yes gene_type:complete
MKIGYIVAILVALLLIVGCKSPEPVVEEPEPVVEEPVVEEEPEEVKPSDAIEIDTSAMSEEDKATLQRYKDACDAGNAGLCAALERMEERLGVAAEDVVEE